MIRIGNLYANIISLDNLRVADVKARKGKLRSHGVRLHDQHRERNILALQKQLQTKTFKTSEYHVFKIIADNNKEREIYRLPYFPDRILHHAIMNVMEPIWVSLFTADTYACIKNRGIHAAVKKMKFILQTDPEHTPYCLKLDIRKFYPSVDHEVLKMLLRRKIKDNDLIQLLDTIIDSAPGLPIGNYLSQYFANVYLTYFDHWLKEVKRVKYYFRYADDMIILHQDKDYLHNLLAEMSNYLKVNLKLDVKSNYQVFPVASRGIDFLGYVFFHTHTLLRKSIKQRLCRRIAHLRRAKITGIEFTKNINAWHGWAKHCNTHNLMKKLSA